MNAMLADYLSSYSTVIAATLDLLAAERRLTDPASSVTSLITAEAAVDKAAQAFADATDALPRESGRRPVGWGEPPAPSGVPEVARIRVAKSVLRCLSAEYGDEGADADAEAEYAEGQLALACRNLAADAEARRAAKAEDAGRLL